MQRHSFAMHTPTLLPAFVLVLGLASCEKATPPPVVQTPPATVQDDAQLIAARDALARQALEIETRSALLDKQLADMEQKLRQSENDALRGQLDAMKQQNEQLRAQADTARQQSDQLSRRLVATTPPPPPVLPPQSPQRDYSLFYDRLAPHGRWLDVSGYGLCFQPRLSRTTTWRPYVDGCWSWSTLGWTWQSNEPFGWATYHYGRWIHLTRHGWLWVPGCEWAPAWVAWRQSRDYIGWAPLPPEPGPCTSIQRDCDTRYNLGPASYTFISVTNFVRPTYTTICRPVSYNSTIFHHTVNSTQIVPCGGPAQGGTPLFMHHGGPPRHQIEQQCRQTIPQTQLRPVEHTHLTAGDLPEGGRKPGKPHLLPVIDLPTLSSRPSLPDIKPAERIDRPQLADTFAGVPDTARPAIQQTLEADRKRPLIADSPHPAPASPSPQPVLSTPQLTETVRRRPYSVVLLDEVEKAHPDVHEIFFQVFDKGWMEDGEGRYIDFKNTIILLTSNVGSDLIMNLCKEPDLMPEPEAIAKAVVQGAYPVIEYRGLLFAYLGHPAQRPAFPRFDVFELPKTHYEPYEAPYAANWIQVTENNLDPAHVVFLHTRISDVQFNATWGLPAKVTYIKADGEEIEIPAKVTGHLCGPGETIELTEPNSGGYGDPLDRVPQMVLEDVLDDFTTVALAREAYGVVIDESSMTVDELSRLWSAFTVPYRPTLCYTLSVVLIESTRSTRSALPVQRANVYALPFEVPHAPFLFIALLLWGFGVWWALLAGRVLRTVATTHGGLGFHLGSWGFVFPTAALAALTIELGRSWSSPVLSVVGALLWVAALVVWGRLAFQTVKGVRDRTLLER